MGRGRAKAKQTKVARKLKYSSGDTDLERLQQELASGGSSPAIAGDDEDEEDDDDLDDPYARLYEDEDDEDDAVTR